MITSYDKLPLGKYLNILRINEGRGEEIDKQVATLAVLTDKSEDELLNMPIGEYSALAKQSKFLEVEPDTHAGRAPAVVNLGKWKLFCNGDIGKMTTVQYIDFQTFAKDAIHNLPQLLSVILVPVGKKYNTDYDIIELQKDIKDSLSVREAYCVSAFFLSRFRASIKGMLIYSKWKARWMRDKEKKAQAMAAVTELENLLEQNGVGLPMLMP